MKPSTAILLIIIAIVIKLNPNIIVANIKPVIRILVTTKTKATKERKVEGVTKQEVTPNKPEQEKLEQPDKVKVFPDYLTTGFMEKGGCIANEMWLNNKKITIWADHCRPNSKGEFNTRQFDSPANSETNELITLREPELGGKSMMSVFRDGSAVEQEVNITSIENCHAFFTIKKGFSRQGDSGARFWRLVNGQRILIGVHHGKQGPRGTNADGLFTFCKGKVPYKY